MWELVRSWVGEVSQAWVGEVRGFAAFFSLSAARIARLYRIAYGLSLPTP